MDRFHQVLFRSLRLALIGILAACGACRDSSHPVQPKGPSWSLRFTVINVANKVALYNFLSTLSGTHYVTPRAETVQLGFRF